MARRSVRRLGLPEEIVESLCSNGLTSATDIFAKTEIQLAHTLDVDAATLTALLAVASARLAPPAKTGADLLRERAGTASSVATRLPTIDAALRGGLPVGMITEVVGPAGVGKSQMCLSAAAAAAMPAALGGLGEGTGVVYLDTERKFSAPRLAEIARQRWPGHYGDAAGEDGEGRLQALLSQVFVFTVDHSVDLLKKLESLQPFIIEKSVRIVILDSVAALARKDFGGGGGGIRPRNEALVRQAAVLKHLADAFSLVVLVTNQVMAARFNSATDGSSGAVSTGAGGAAGTTAGGGNGDSASGTSGGGGGDGDWEGGVSDGG
ncbi:unnamed protein product, partial [Phaeothamnion confervicola]